MKVLLVEPDPHLARSVSERLLADAIRPVRAVAGLREALGALEAQPWDVVVTEVDLPDGDGFSLCREARARGGGAAVLFLADRDGEEVAVTAFRAGADDFVPKRGLSLRELSLRVRALRRVPPGAREVDPSLALGPIRIEPATGAVWLDGHRVDLTQLEVRLLTALASRPGRVLSRSQLLAGVWGAPHALQERTVDSAVKRLRARIGRAGQWIETVRGVGYRTRAPAHE